MLALGAALLFELTVTGSGGEKPTEAQNGKLGSIVIIMNSKPHSTDFAAVISKLVRMVTLQVMQVVSK